MRRTLIALLLLCLHAAAGQHSVRRGRFVTAAGTDFRDTSGRRLVLHGINVANKSREQRYTGGLSRSDFAAIRGWGMNTVRLAIFWDALEPEPGRFDEAYLDRVARIVGWAKAERLYVLLDMHQDLYSHKFPEGDGAPLWATLDDGKAHVRGAVWSDAYFASAAVQAALDHFWANSPAPGGMGLQDHYALAWKRVAERFRDEPAVAGYDIMNEPFPGSDGLRMQIAMLEKLSALKKPSIPASRLIALESTPDGRRQITGWLADMELYAGMLEAGAPIMQDFERGRLMPMYQRVRRAIRSVDTQHILFLEPAMSTNMGIRSALEPIADDAGRRDPQQAYAPHGYDIVTDTDSGDLGSNARVEMIFRRHGELARKWRMPMLVGEWGAYYLNAKAAAAARFAVQQFESLGCGDTYWDYTRELGKSPLLDALGRPARTHRP